MYTQTYILTYILVYIQTYIHTYILSCMHTSILVHTYLLAYIQTVHAYFHTYTYTYIHTYVHRTKFNRDNLHLTARQEDTGQAQLVHVIEQGFKQIGRQMGDIHGSLENLSVRITSLETKMDLYPGSSQSPVHTHIQHSTTSNEDVGEKHALGVLCDMYICYV